LKVRDPGRIPLINPLPNLAIRGGGAIRVGAPTAVTPKPLPKVSVIDLDLVPVAVEEAIEESIEEAIRDSDLSPIAVPTSVVVAVPVENLNGVLIPFGRNAFLGSKISAPVVPGV